VRFSEYSVRGCCPKCAEVSAVRRGDAAKRFEINASTSAAFWRSSVREVRSPRGEERHHPGGPAVPIIDVLRLRSLAIHSAKGFDDGLQMIALDLTVQSAAGDPESSRGLCQISVRGLQRPLDGEVLEVIETCGLGRDG
jgi:hypothetical protein